MYMNYKIDVNLYTSTIWNCYGKHNHSLYECIYIFVSIQKHSNKLIKIQWSQNKKKKKDTQKFCKNTRIQKPIKIYNFHAINFAMAMHNTYCDVLQCTAFNRPIWIPTFT